MFFKKTVPKVFKHVFKNRGSNPDSVGSGTFPWIRIRNSKKNLSRIQNKAFPIHSSCLARSRRSLMSYLVKFYFHCRLRKRWERLASWELSWWPRPRRRTLGASSYTSHRSSSTHRYPYRSGTSRYRYAVSAGRVPYCAKKVRNKTIVVIYEPLPLSWNVDTGISI